jgi:hypothetical protein
MPARLHAGGATMMQHTVTPIGGAPLQVTTEDDDCEFCEAVRQHFKHARGVVFFEIPEAPNKVQRVSIVWPWPLVLACGDITRAEMREELAQ